MLRLKSGRTFQDLGGALPRNMRLYSNEESTYLEHKGVAKESKDAKLFRIVQQATSKVLEIWVPRSQIQCADKTILGVPTWFARKHNL